MGELNILFLRGAYLTKIEQLRSLLNDVSVTNSDDFREELLSALRDGALASWCDKRGFALTGIDMSADDKPLYETIVKKITGKTDFKAADKAFVGNFAEPLKEDDIKFDDDILKITIHPIKPTNDKFKFVLKNKKGEKISNSKEIDWKDKTKNTSVQLTFDIKGSDKIDLELWVNESEKVKTNPFVTPFTVKGVTFKMILVNHGTFIMGSTLEKAKTLAHKVTISKDYYMGETPVTQALWQAVMGDNPSEFKGDNNPVEKVSWDDCQEFIKKLNELTGQKFRLPTEAEWEFAARGGNKSNHTLYAGSSNIEEVAWYESNSWCERNSRRKVHPLDSIFITNSIRGTHPVAQKTPNELGLYDMSGNVSEWCNDWYYAYYYADSPLTDPQGPTSGNGRVLRGGGYLSSPTCCLLSFRNPCAPFCRSMDYGLRLAL